MLQLKVGKEVNRVGIMGGTFDPIHMGHLVTAEEARQQFNLDHVVFVPVGDPPHKEGQGVSDPEHRYLMAVLAVITNPYFTVSRIEIECAMEGPTYTINTINAFRNLYEGKASFYFISGADAILDILTWKDYPLLLNSCQFIAASRPGYNLSRIQETISPAYPSILKKVHLLEIPAMAISSTAIRERVREGKTIKYLTPEAVEHYIIKNNLWQ